MDYEKKYNEALEKAKRMLASRRSVIVEKQALESIFPQLRESEDERIRKEMISFLRSPFIKENLTDEKVAPWLAWLEKQKEPTTEELYAEAGTTEKEYIANTMKKVRAMRERKKEQKPISSCDIVPYIDDKIAALQDMWREEKVSFDWDDMKDMIEDVARHFYQQEQKPAWSEEDADILNCCISSIEEAKENRYAYKETDGDTSYDREIAWLKSRCPNLKK